MTLYDVLMQQSVSGRKHSQLERHSSNNQLSFNIPLPFKCGEEREYLMIKDAPLVGDLASVTELTMTNDELTIASTFQRLPFH